MLSYITRLYQGVFKSKRDRTLQELMKRLVHSTDEIVMLRESNERYRKALEEIKDENELLWDQLSDIQASDRALKRQMSEAMEDAYYRNIKPVGDA